MTIHCSSSDPRSRSLVTGQAGWALGERGVGIVETQTGAAFTGSVADWARFGRGVAGDLSGVNSGVEAGYGYDISTQEQLSGLDRLGRAGQSMAALSGNALGGLHTAARFAPGVFPTAAGLTAAASAPTSATHLTNAAGKAGIESSGMLNGPSSAWALESGRVPATAAGRFLKTLVRPSRTTHLVENINPGGLIRPPIRSPFSLYQRMVGVLRTPGPGAYNIRTGQFFAGQMYDSALGGLRPMSRCELFMGGIGHDLILDGVIGWGGTITVGVGAYDAYYLSQY